MVPGKSGLHVRGEGERVLALESREGTRASRRVEEEETLISLDFCRWPQGASQNAYEKSGILWRWEAIESVMPYNHLFLFYDGLERLFPLKVCMKQTKKQKRHLLLLFSRSVMSDSLQPHGLHTARQAFLSTISSSLLKLMSIESLMPSNHLILCRSLLLLPSVFSSISSFPMSQLFASGGQNIGVSAPASVLPMNIQG